MSTNTEAKTREVCPTRADKLNTLQTQINQASGGRGVRIRVRNTPSGFAAAHAACHSLQKDRALRRPQRGVRTTRSSPAESSPNEHCCLCRSHTCGRCMCSYPPVVRIGTCCLPSGHCHCSRSGALTLIKPNREATAPISPSHVIQSGWHSVAHQLAPARASTLWQLSSDHG